MTTQSERWSGDFGNAYTARNRVDWRKRAPFWRGVLDKTGARSVFELGCNAGWNLSAILRAEPQARVYGWDVNEDARAQADLAGISTVIPLGRVDLAMTVGVLIHVPPQEVRAVMQSVMGRSADYVLAVEYAAEEETEIEYRGERGLLWKRPFGELYEAMGLTLVDTGDPGPAFDRCTYWLMRRP